MDGDGADADARGSACSPPCADLPADALRDIAGRLRDATDLVRFHAVCRAWRDAPPPTRFHPWLLARRGFSTTMRFRSPLSRRGMSLPQFPANRGRALECSEPAEGRVVASGNLHDRRGTRLNPLTGDATRVHRMFEDGGSRPSYNLDSVNGALQFHREMSYLVPAMQRLVEAGQEARVPDLIRRVSHAKVDLPPHPGRDRYVLQLEGKLLCFDVLEDIQPCLRHLADAPALVSVQELGLYDDAGTPRWMVREHSLVGTEHLCFFLGWESSFVIDARDFAGAEITGGTAYFIGTRKAGKEAYGVYRYSFEDGTATLVDELPVRFNKKSMWFVPRPRLLSAVRASQDADGSGNRSYPIASRAHFMNNRIGSTKYIEM